MSMFPADDESIRLAAEIIIEGGLVAFPTETVYGLGADALNPAALARIFEVKGRPRFDPLIIHIAGLDMLEGVADIQGLPYQARRCIDVLIRRLWPGPLTLVLPKQRRIPDLATGGLSTAAVRFPAHPVAQALIRLSTRAVAAPSANPFGYLSPTRAEHVQRQLGDKIDLILNGGRSLVGVESTVLDFCSGPPRILRPGGVSQERIEALIGPVAAETAGENLPAPRSPGLLKSHYAPRTPLSLYPLEAMVSRAYDPQEGYLFFDGPSRDAWLAAQTSRLPEIHAKTSPESRIRVLSDRGDLREAAANLFDLLHELDCLGLSHIRAEQAPVVGLGPAINDRLFKARNAAKSTAPGKNLPINTPVFKKVIPRQPPSRSKKKKELAMADNQYLALLRGINVGGNNIIAMERLKQSFEEMRFTNIITYIQSGNIIFTGKEENKTQLTTRIEKKLSNEYNYNSRVVLLTFSELKEIIDDIPTGFGEDKETYRYDLWFLKEPLTAEEVMKTITPREGVDQVYQGKRVIYASRLISLASKSHLTKIIQHPVYQRITVRNWNTAYKLFELMRGV